MKKGVSNDGKRVTTLFILPPPVSLGSSLLFTTDLPFLLPLPRGLLLGFLLEPPLFLFYFSFGWSD